MRSRGAGTQLPLGAGLVLGAAGSACIGAGVWAWKDVRATLARERINGTAGPVHTAGAARALAETIRESTMAATGGRTYAETPSYLGPGGSPTSDAEAALRDERSGSPVRNPDVDLWLQATTLQSALMQAFMGFRIAELSIAVGGSLLAAGAGLTAVARRHP